MNIRNALVLTTAVAAALTVTGCGSSHGSYTTYQDTAVCTDRLGHRVDDSYCGRSYYGHGYYPIYLHSYDVVPSYGSTVIGSRTPVAGRSYVPSTTAYTSSISRGGFGSSAGEGGFGGIGE